MDTTSVQTNKKNNTSTILFTVGAVVVVGAGIALATFISQQNNKSASDENSSSAVSTPTATVTSTPTSIQTASPSNTPSITATTTVIATKYKDGKYTDSANYFSPGGTEGVTITVTISNDKISDVSFAGTTDNSTSKRYQDMFASGFKSQVVGKKVDDVRLSRVSGSSLTSNAFNSALAKIKDKVTI